MTIPIRCICSISCLVFHLLHNGLFFPFSLSLVSVPEWERKREKNPRSSFFVIYLTTILQFLESKRTKTRRRRMQFWFKCKKYTTESKEAPWKCFYAMTCQQMMVCARVCLFVACRHFDKRVICVGNALYGSKWKAKDLFEEAMN